MHRLEWHAEMAGGWGEDREEGGQWDLGCAPNQLWKTLWTFLKFLLYQLLLYLP